MAAGMFGVLFFDWDVGQLLSNPLWLPLLAFQVWMLVDAVRRAEWFWAAFIFLFPFINAALYFVLVYRAAPSLAAPVFELPGQATRARIAELEAQIRNLDKAHFYTELGDIYFHQGKLDKAEAAYQSALERDPSDADTRAHYGQLLLRRDNPSAARKFLEAVCAENPKHDYGNTLMSLAETLMQVGDKQAAIAVWRQVLEFYSYPRAQVQLAELYAEAGQSEAARVLLQDVVSESAATPAFQRQREREWIRRAKRLLSRLH